MSCGSCWAFSTSESFADRLFVSGVAAPEVIISPQTLVSCDTSNTGCNGGYLSYAWEFLANTGSTTCTDLCTSGCDVYVSGNCSEGTDSNGDGCVSCHLGTCTAGGAWPVTYKAMTYFQVGGWVSAIQSEISINGPVATCFTIYQNFYSFFEATPTGVYTSTSGSNIGGHCVLVVGWGTQGGVDYWMVKNSWSAAWGDNGYFRMARGLNLGGTSIVFCDSVAGSDRSSSLLFRF
jgi:cathepsin B